MLNYDEPEIINVGSGIEISIGDLAALIVRVTGCRSKLVFDTSKPDGTPRKLMDNSHLTSLGWKARIGLEEGIASAYQWYVESLK
jgi:GDP-L-fucose synthase